MPYKDIDAKREYQRLWVAARREKYVSLCGGMCVECGLTIDLEFDHIDSGEKVSHRIWSWSESRLEAELAKCRLLCRQCHEAKSVAEQNYPTRQHGTNLMYTNGRCRCVDCKAAHAAVNTQYR